MRYLTVEEVLILYHQMMRRTGGSPGLRDQGALLSALAQPKMTFDGVELYPTLIDKASALGYSLIMNHPFIDGNKRIGHLSVEAFLFLNGMEIQASVSEQEEIILRLAAGELSRSEWTAWLEAHVVPL